MRLNATLGVAQNRPRLTPADGESGVACRHCQVAHRDRLAAGRGRDALHLVDHRHGQALDRQQHAAAFGEQAFIVGLVRRGAHLLQIVPGAKRLAGRVDDDATRIVIGGLGIERGLPRRQHGLGQRIEGLRPVQRQLDDTAVVALDADQVARAHWKGQPPDGEAWPQAPQPPASAGAAGAALAVANTESCLVSCWPPHCGQTGTVVDRSKASKSRPQSSHWYS